MEPLDDTEIRILAKMLTSHAYREKLAVTRFRYAIRIAPTREDRTYFRKVVTEEETHFRGCLEVGTLLGIDLQKLVTLRRRTRRYGPGIPTFRTWLDVLLAHALNDQAGYYVLKGLKGSKVAAYSRLACRIVAEEESHGSHGSAMLTRYLKECDRSDPSIHEALVVHLDSAARCIGRPDSTLDAEAVKLRLKSRSALDTLAEFCRYADELLAKVGYADLTPIINRYTVY